MDTDGGVESRVHGDPANATDIGQGEDVGDRFGVKPHLAKVREHANLGGVLKTTVGEGAEDATAVADVSEHVWVVKHGDRALRVE